MCVFCVYANLKHENSEIRQSILSGKFTFRFISACHLYFRYLFLFHLLWLFIYNFSNLIPVSIYILFCGIPTILKQGFLYQIAICKSYAIIPSTKDNSCLTIVQYSNPILTYLGTICFRRPSPHHPFLFIFIIYIQKLI